jgi:NADPH:quinone reductase-like Zn-dependent oxidoreductase/predicted transcriptional regulator
VAFLSSDKGYGSIQEPASVLRFSNYQDLPDIEDEDVLVEVFCFSITRFDVKMLIEHPLGTGTPTVTTPMIPCIDGAGVVSEVGANARRFKVGDGVFFSLTDLPGKAAAEWVRVPESMVAPLPRGVSFKDAACFGSAASAAIEGIDWMEFKPGPGKVILVLGGATDVGSCVIRYCKHLSWEVMATAAGIEACEWCHRMGADRVINTEEADGKWVACIKAHSVDGVFETRGAPNNFADAEVVLKSSGGCFVSIAPKEGHTVADAASFLPSYLWRKLVSPFSYFCFTEYDCSSQDKMDKICKLASAGVLPSLAYGVYEFDVLSVQKAFAQVSYDLVPGRPVVVIKSRFANQKGGGVGSNGRSATVSAIGHGAVARKAWEAEESIPPIIATVARSQTIAGGDTDARARAKQAAETAWVAFKRWCDSTIAAVEKLSSPPEGLADLKNRQEKLKKIREDVTSEGKQLYESLERAVEQVVKLGIKVGVSEALYKENAAKVSETVKKADKAIARLISKLESTSGSSSSPPSRSGSVLSNKPLQLAAESAWAAFLKWCEKVNGVVTSLSLPPEGLSDLQNRQAKIKVVTSEMLPEGKVLFDAAEKAILAAADAKVRLAGDLSVTILKKAAEEVSSSVQVADKAIKALIRKLETEAERQRANSKAVGLNKGKEALQTFKNWLTKTLSEVEALSSPPQGVEDLRTRSEKVVVLKEKMAFEGKAVFDAVSGYADVLGLKTADLQKEVSNVAGRLKTAETAITTLLTKFEHEAASNEAKEKVGKFKVWAQKKLSQVDGLSEAHRGVQDLRERAKTLSGIRADAQDNGPSLYNAAVSAAKAAGGSASEAEVQELMQNVSNRIKQAEKAIAAMIKSEEEKQESAQKAVDVLRTWCAEVQIEMDSLSNIPEGLEDMRLRSKKVADIKANILEKGKTLYNKALEQAKAAGGGGVTEEDLQKLMESVTTRIKGAEKAITTLLKREEDKFAAKLQQQRERATDATNKLLAFYRQQLKEVEALSSPSEGLEDMIDREKKVASIRLLVQEKGKLMYEAADSLLQGLSGMEASVTGMQEEMTKFSNAIKLAEKAIAAMKKEEERKQAEGEAVRRKAQEAVKKVVEFCDRIMDELEGLASIPEGLEDLRRRVKKTSQLQKEVKGDGQDLLAECNRQQAIVSGDVSMADAAAQFKEMEDRLQTTDKSCSTLLRLEEEKRVKEESAAQRKEREAAEKKEQALAAASDAVESFRGWVNKMKSLIQDMSSSLSSASLQELQDRVERAAACKNDLGARGEPLLEACVPHLEVINEDRAALSAELVEVSNAFSKLEKTLKQALDEKTLEKQAAESRAAANDALSASLAKFHDWYNQKRADIEAVGRSTADAKTRAAELATIKADVQNSAPALFSACKGTTEDLEGELRKLADQLKATERLVKKEEAGANFTGALNSFQEWSKGVKSEVERLIEGDVDDAELQIRRDRLAALKTEVQEIGKQRYDAVLATLKDNPDAKVTKSDLENEIRGVAKQVGDAQKTIATKLKKPKADVASEAENAALVSFRSWCQNKVGAVDEISAAASMSLAELKASTEKLDLVRAEVKENGKELYDKCPKAFKEELDKLVKSVSDALKKKSALLEELLAKATEAEVAATVEPVPETTDEVSKDGNGEATDGETSTAGSAISEKMAARKAQLAAIKSKRDVTAAPVAAVDGDKMSALKARMAARSETKSGADVEGAAAAAKESLDSEPESGVSPRRTGTEAATPDDKQSKMAALKAKMAARNESKKGGELTEEATETTAAPAAATEAATPDDKQSKMAALKAKMAARNESKKGGELTEEATETTAAPAAATEAATPDDKQSKMAALKAKMAARNESKKGGELTEEATEAPAAAADGEKGSDRKALLEKLKSRKKLDGAAEAADEEPAAEEGEAKSVDRKALLAKLKSRSKVDEEEEPAAAGADSAEAKKLALKQKLAERAASKKAM